MQKQRKPQKNESMFQKATHSQRVESVLAVCKLETTVALLDLMHLLKRLFAAVAILCCCVSPAHAGGRKQAVTIRFYAEVDAATADPFAMPVHVGSPERHIFHESAASLSERQIVGAYVYQNKSGEWLALFKLDPSGQMTLANISATNRGKSLVAYVGDSKIARLIPNDILIDRPVSDGILQLRGLHPKEILLIQARFPALKPAAS